MKKVDMDFLLHSLMVMTICFVTATAGRTYCTSASGNSLKIARKADEYLGSTKWAFTSKRRTGMNTDKDHIFVAEVAEWAGASVPHKHWYSWSPVTATDWGNSRSSDLTSSNCWNLVTSCYKSGDVIAGAGHVGIVTGKDRTTHATREKIVKDNWGFANGEGRTVWRYVC